VEPNAHPENPAERDGRASTDLTVGRRAELVAAHTHGEAIVAPPGTIGRGSVALPRPMVRIGSSAPVSTVALSCGQGRCSRVRPGRLS
jgi:hypothetical protein